MASRAHKAATSAPKESTETPDTSVIFGDKATAEKPSADIQKDKTFADFGVSAPICEALAEHGIIHPFQIQALTLPIALKRQDIIGQAKTGTGKTLGFAIPILENVVGPGEAGFEEIFEHGRPQALVILPTRELAKQVAVEIRNAAAKRRVRVCEIYGGIAFEPQIKELKEGVEIVVGTPGRIIDLMKHRTLSLAGVQTVVLDEADEMLDLGFLPDVELLLSRIPANRHTMLFSATMPGQVVSLARQHMQHPTHIRAEIFDDAGATVKETRQLIYRTHALNKLEVVSRILQAKGRGLTIIFTRTKRTVARLAEDLDERGFATAALHGNLGQGAREQALRAFRNGKVDVLVATDVAARGIDVDNVTQVINYQCPEDAKTYIHRVGRTGRAGHKGTAITFVDWDDVPRWKLIDKEIELGQPEPVETYHTSAHLYTDLDIPEDVNGRLPRSQRNRAGLSAEKLEDLQETGRGSRGQSRGRRRGTGRDRGGHRQGRGGRNREQGSDSAGKARDHRPARKRKRIRKNPGHGQ